MTDDELIAYLDNEHSQASKFQWDDLANEREENLKYYLREPFGDEEEGRSKVVSSHVSDTVEWMLPSLLKVFTATEKAVEFEPSEQNDVEAANQATEACNYVFYRQNPGFLILYTLIKDGLLSKTGAVKWWWDDKKSTRLEKYRGLSDDQLTMLGAEENIEVLGHTASLIENIEVPPEQNPNGASLHDVDVRIKKDANKICVAAFPPEELLVSRRHNSPLLEDCPYVAHLCRKTVSEIRDLGFDVDPEDLSTTAATDMTEGRSLSYRRGGEETLRTDTSDPSMREGWIHEEYALVDYDDDGLAERRRIIRSGKKILLNEETDSVQIAAWTPVILTHTFFGMCPADESKDLQRLGSTLWRQMLDNLYVANQGRKAVLSSPDGRVQANLDDLLSAHPNQIVREYVPNAVRPLETPWVAAQAFPMLEYVDQQRMNRTGSNNLTSGLDADAINKTARGATLAQNQMVQREELIARVFGELALKPMFRGILRLLSRYSTRPMMFRLRNQFVEYDPRAWKNEYDMTVNVGLGTGNKDQQLVHLQTIGQAQQVAIQMGGLNQLVTLKNVYNVQAKIAENAGFKNVDDFWTDPETAEPPPPQPNPEMEKVKMESQMKQAELQMRQQEMVGEFQLKQADMQQKWQLEQAKHEQSMVMQREQEANKLSAQKEMHSMTVKSQEKPSVMVGNVDEEIREAVRTHGDGLNQLTAAVSDLKEVTHALVELVQDGVRKAGLPKRLVRDGNGKTGGWEVFDPETGEVVGAGRVVRDGRGRAIGTENLDNRH